MCKFLANLLVKLTHWGRETQLCICKININGSDKGLSSGRRQAIIWTNAGILLIGPLRTNFSEILREIHSFSFKKMHLKMSSAKWRPFCLGLNELTSDLVAHMCVNVSFTSLSPDWESNHHRPLAHWGRDKMEPIFQTAFWNGFFKLEFHEFR